MAIVLPELLDELAQARHPRAASLRAMPRAIVLADDRGTELDPTTHLDAVNDVAHRLGVSPRQTISQATAIVENLVIQTVPPSSVMHALELVAEAALGFGSPVAFRAPDTVWVDITGTSHLFGGARPLASLLSAHVQELGHVARVAVASGPWLARAFAQHADFDETGVFLSDADREAGQAGLLPIAALPIPSEVVTWFSRLGLLSLNELRQLPRSALAARLGPDAERVLALIYGRDDGVLDAYHPEELPFEQQSWDAPLDNIEPLLFVLKGLCARLASRLEGRGQAARELRLVIQYDRSIAALRHREHEAASVAGEPARPGSQDAPLDTDSRSNAAGSTSPGDGVGQRSLVEELQILLGSPLVHADDLERISRARLQRETLRGPASGLRLEVTAITEARHWQLGLNADGNLGQLSADPTLITVLVNELSADVGAAAVGVLEAHDSHLLEKSSGFASLQSEQSGRASAREHAPRGAARRGSAPRREGSTSGASRARSPKPQRPRPSLSKGSGGGNARAARPPTRLISPLEIEAPLEKNELVVIDQRAYVIESIRFEERLEAVEWWAPKPVSRDYFRLWLTALSASAPLPMMPRRRDGLEVLVYLNRDDGKKYVQAIYD